TRAILSTDHGSSRLSCRLAWRGRRLRGQPAGKPPGGGLGWPVQMERESTSVVRASPRSGETGRRADDSRSGSSVTVAAWAPVRCVEPYPSPEPYRSPEGPSPPVRAVAAGSAPPAGTLSH